jgi:hypothetical protein
MESMPSLVRGKETAAKKGPRFLRLRPHPPKMERQHAATVAREMYCYLRWVRDVTTMTYDEIITKVMDRALSDYFRRDRAWRSLRGQILSKYGTGDWRDILSNGSTRAAVRAPRRQ